MNVANQSDFRLTPPTDDETLVLLIRHGESAWNVESRFQGQAANVPLSALGIEQAEALARWLSGQGLRQPSIYSSDSMRASHTAEIVADALHAPLDLAPQLREVDVGSWQGLTVAEIEARWPGELQSRDADIGKHRLPGGETGYELQDRIHSYFKALLKDRRGETLLLVSHGASLAALRAAIHGWDLSAAWRERRMRLGNSGVTAISFNHVTGEQTVLLEGSIAHLSVEPADSGQAQ